MKKYQMMIMAMMILASPSLLKAQWFWQNPLPTGNSLKSVYFTDSNTGWAVGDVGIIFKTTNIGGKWISHGSVPLEGLSSAFLPKQFNVRGSII
jgi:hypothetical protein